MKRVRFDTPRRLRGVPLVAALVGVALTGAPSAHADVAACVAASENEVGLRKAGKLRDALQQLVICAAPSCPTEISTECKRRSRVLNAELPTVVLSAADGAGNDIAAVTVTLDGAPFATKLDGLAVPIDLGTHVLHFESPGKPSADKTVVIHEGELGRRVSVVLGAQANGASGAQPTVGAWSTNKTLALVSGGLGVVGLGVGSVFGILSFSEASTAKSDCTTAACTPAGHVSAESEHSTASTAGTVSTAAFVIGGAGLVAGVLLWFTAPKGETGPSTAPTVAGVSFEPNVSTRGGGMMLSGSFR
jgi:hypothetical protein